MFFYLFLFQVSTYTVRSFPSILLYNIPTAVSKFDFMVSYMTTLLNTIIDLHLYPFVRNVLVKINEMGINYVGVVNLYFYFLTLVE